MQCPGGSSDSCDGVISREELCHECGKLKTDSLGNDDAEGSGRDRTEDPLARGEQKEEIRERSSCGVGQSSFFLVDMAPFIVGIVLDARVNEERRWQDILVRWFTVVNHGIEYPWRGGGGWRVPCRLAADELVKWSDQARARYWMGKTVSCRSSQRRPDRRGQESGLGRCFQRSLSPDHVEVHRWVCSLEPVS